MKPHPLKSGRNWFWHEQDNRLRAFWRIMLTFVAFVIITRGIRTLLVLLTGRQVLLADTTPGDILRLVVLLLVLWLMAKYVDKRPFSDYGLTLQQKPFWINFGFGLVLGSLLITAVFTVEYGLGWVTIIDTFVRATNVWFGLALLLPLSNLIAAAIFVELFFRGYLVINLAESFKFLRVLYQPNPPPGQWTKLQLLRNNLYQRSTILAAWIVATAFFLLYRASDGMVSNVWLLNLLRASFLLTLPFLITRNLGMSIGLTLGWNFFASSVYGLRVQELITTRTSVLAVLVKGPPGITGGEAGPEAGLTGMGAIILGGVIVMLWLRYQQKHMPPDFDPWVFAYKKRE